MLALIATLLLGQPRTQPQAFLQPDVGRARGGSGGVVFTVAEEVVFTSGSSLPVLPASGVGLYLPNIDGGSTWEGYDKNGAVLSGTTQGTGTLFVGTFASNIRTMQDVSDARAPQTNNAGVLGLSAGDYTIICAGYATTRGDPSIQVWWESLDGAKDVVGVSQSSSFRCSEDGLTHHADSITGYGQPLDGWAVTWCRRSGNTLCAGTQDIASEGCITRSPVGATTTHMTMGKGYLAGNAMRGPLAWCAFFGADVGLPYINDVLWKFYGVQQSTAMLSNTNTHDVPQLLGRDNTPTTGNVDMFKSYAVVADPTLGVSTLKAFSNSWAADPLDVSSWTKSAGATVDGNLVAGPFGRWKNTTPCGRVSGATGEYVQSDTVPSLDGGASGSGWYNASVFVIGEDAGNSTRGRIQWVTDGTFDGGNADSDAGCNFNVSLDAGRQPANTGCYSWIDNPSVVQAKVELVNGSLYVCQGSLTQSLNMKAPTVDNGSKGNGWVALDGGALPSGARKGGIEVVAQLQTSSGQYATLGNSKSVASFLEDAFASAAPNHIVTHTYGDQVDTPSMLAILYGPSFGTENYLITPLAINARTWFAVALKWTTSGGLCAAKSYFDVCPDQSNPSTCVATTLINTGTPGECPDQADTINLADRFDNTDIADINVAVLRVYQ